MSGGWTIESARAALAEFDAGYRAGGEPHYPQGAATFLAKTQRAAIATSSARLARYFVEFSEPVEVSHVSRTIRGDADKVCSN